MRRAVGTIKELEPDMGQQQLFAEDRLDAMVRRLRHLRRCG